MSRYEVSVDLVGPAERTPADGMWAGSWEVEATSSLEALARVHRMLIARAALAADPPLNALNELAKKECGAGVDWEWLVGIAAARPPWRVRVHWHTSEDECREVEGEVVTYTDHGIMLKSFDEGGAAVGMIPRESIKRIDVLR